MTIENEATPVAADAPEAHASTPDPVALSVPETTTEGDSPDDRLDADLRGIWAKNNPPRDDGGRFRATNTAQAETEVSQDQPETSVAETPVASIPVPQSWSSDVRDKWGQLPPELQTYIASRESESHQAITRQGQELKAIESVKSVIEQNKDIFERNGLSADDGISRLLSAERLLDSDPYSAIERLASAYGVDLAKYSGQQQQPGSAEQALHQRIAFLESRLNDTSNRIAERERHEAQTQTQSMTALIEKFADGKADWTDLENDILAEIIGIKAAVAEGAHPDISSDQLLTKAYERAQRNNPVAWQKKLASEQKAANEKKVAEAQKRAEDAKKANIVNIRSSPADGRSPQSMDDTLRQTYRKAHSN
jgi:hypothetical protein